MLIDGRRVASGSILHADVCIVGAGPAGLALADSLVGCGRRVLLLEAGGARHIDSVEALELETSGEPLEPLATVDGGSSAARRPCGTHVCAIVRRRATPAEW